MAFATLTERKFPIHVQQRGAGFATSSLLLDRFLPQGAAGDEKKQSVQQDKRVLWLSDTFERHILGYQSIHLAWAVQAVEPAARDFNCTPRELSLFVETVLAKYSGTANVEVAAGLYLSALMNTSTEMNFILRTGGLPFALDYIGFYNVKEITIHGDAGCFCGAFIGGGTLTVHGNAGESLGFSIKGGTIRVNGNILSLGDIDESIKMGNIFQYERLLMKNGEIINQPIN